MGVNLLPLFLIMEKIEKLLQKYNCVLEKDNVILHSSGKKIVVELNKNFFIHNIVGMSIAERLLFSLEECLQNELGVK